MPQLRQALPGLHASALTGGADLHPSASPFPPPPHLVPSVTPYMIAFPELHFDVCYYKKQKLGTHLL
jgi:hypothetical protein